MRRLRQFVNAVTFAAAVLITLGVGARVIRQLITGQTPAVSQQSAAFRQYQEARAIKRREDWALLSQMANQDVSKWSETRQDAVLNEMENWLREKNSFDPYFRRLSNDQIATMQDNMILLAVRWLETRVALYARSNQRTKTEIIKEDTDLAISLAMVLGRLDGPFGPGIVRGTQRLQEVQERLSAEYGFFSPMRVAAVTYFSALFNSITEWQRNGGLEELRRQRNF